MRISHLVFVLCLGGVFLAAGCSREEEPPTPVQKAKIMKKPVPKPQAEQPKPVPPPVQEKPKVEAPVKAEEPKAAVPQTGTPEKARQEVVAQVQEKPRPEAQAPVKPEKKETRTDATPKATPPGPSEKSPKREEAKAFYVVKKGDTLAKVSKRSEVYGDPLKWPILYRMNIEALNSLPHTERLPELELTEGIRLRILPVEEMKKNQEKRVGRPWVVNVLSAVSNAEVVPAVISLVKNGYPAYITTARVNDKDWMRVRVGFFKTRAEAEEDGKKIMNLLRFQDSWTTKLGASEFAEFAGY